MALVASGSTTMQGPYSTQIRRAVDYLFTKRRENGLIGEPLRDNRYTYGHGYSMVFLSQVFGEEEDEELTLRDIGEILGLSRERVRQIESRAEAKCRRSVRRA